MAELASRARRFIKRLLGDVVRWGPTARAGALPEKQREKILDEHWRNS
ncbi:MAG: hypothetical protein ACRBK7_10655 [Acidimicrobiales bacterium]